ncbi:hypothetical protein G6O67_001347 [Ophiocordyceps sinensis]|uniref:Uncharacterized protein n=2 Tax=Ophiocordyceps sinensis TaxID=72228 RepID=A0A8H4PXQ2_9HYPO|nr:hypothetical protein OCS_06830 [Ophiocordyceps sinensis CO18]KAF4512173.1 hypothetical protein G6O67_001347 [Ophiocordyceps sinensis]
MDSKPVVADESASGDPQSMEEAHLNMAILRLKLLYSKVRNLRETIPRMLEPLVQKHPSPDVMFNAFMRAVEDAQADVTEVTELMKDEESKQVFARADKSREQNPFGIKPWKHTGDSEWLKTEDKD